MTALRSSAKRAVSLVTSALLSLTILSAFTIATSPAALADGVGVGTISCATNAASANCGVAATSSGWSSSSSSSTNVGPGGSGGSASNDGSVYYSGYCTWGSGGGTATSADHSHGSATVYPTGTGVTQAEATAQCVSPVGTQTITSKTKPTSTTPSVFGVTCAPHMINGEWTPAISVYARAAGGWQKIPGTNPQQWKLTWEYACAYPDKSPKDLESVTVYGDGVCIISGEYYFMESGSASIANTGTASSKGSGTQLLDSGLRTVPFKIQYPGMVCSKNMMNVWSKENLPTYANGEPIYGFYRIATHITYRTCHLHTPDAWTHGSAYVVCDPPQRMWQHNRYTYTCTNGFVAAPGNMVNQADAKYFDEKTCALKLNPNAYVCHINRTNIAKPRADETVSVMRNGGDVPVAFSKLGVTGKYRNKHSEQRATYVVKGSSPYRGSYSASASNSGEMSQFFKLSTDKVGQKMIPFGTPDSDVWNSISSVGNNGYMFYFWASNPGKTWQMNSKYRFIAQLQIVKQDRVDSGTYLDWSKDLTLYCNNESPSSIVTVLRSVNTN